jgi:hypothetical protein
MKRKHRSALLALAAERGEKGFSSVLADAIQTYLDGESERVRQREEFESLKGSLSVEESEDLRSRARAMREHWR